MMAGKEIGVGAPSGGAFLFGPAGQGSMVTAETLSQDQRAYFLAMRQFTEREVIPHIERLENKDLGLLRELLRKAGELGLLLAEIPEAYGGLELDVTTAMRISEATSLFGSWSVTVGCHTGIGSLPIVYFGTETQKKKYLPRLATAEWVAAYALTEPTSGSDALGARTSARLSPDGKLYLLNGSKQFITNAGIADVFVVFAKIDGDKFTGFVVERSSPGLTVGPEEHKMGIRGSSTCPLFFEDCQVPVENVLGEIGKGHRIAFNILNLGRLKLGVGSVGGSRNILGEALRYVRERKQFGKALIEFPLIREKLARSAAAIHALESMAYRTTGMIDARIAARRDARPDAPMLVADRPGRVIQAVEEYSIEASILKVMGSETLGAVVDEALQMHGGYGYIQGSLRRAGLPRRAHQSAVRGDQRDQPDVDLGHAAQAGEQGTAPAGRGDRRARGAASELPGRARRSTNDRRTAEANGRDDPQDRARAIWPRDRVAAGGAGSDG